MKDILATNSSSSIVRNAMLTNQYTTADSILEVLIRTENKSSQAFVGATFKRNNRYQPYNKRGNFRGNNRGNFRGNYNGGYRNKNRGNFRGGYRGNSTNNFNRGNYASRSRNAKRVYFMESSPPYPMIEGPSQGN